MPLTFTTPSLKTSTAQASALITVDYTVNSKIYQFNRIINFVRINDTSTKGAIINSGAFLTNAGNDTAYANLHLYGSGINQIYKVDSITANKGGIKIIQGDITGKQLQSNYVEVIEVSAPANITNTNLLALRQRTHQTSLVANSGFNATLTVLSSLTDGTQFTSTANIGVASTISGAILDSGNVPIINTSVENPQGSMYITNSGSADATLGSIIFPQGVVQTTGDRDCGTIGTILAVGAGCIIYFTLPQEKGNGNITLNYSGGEPPNWYKLLPGTIVLMMSYYK